MNTYYRMVSTTPYNTSVQYCTTDWRPASNQLASDTFRWHSSPSTSSLTTVWKSWKLPTHRPHTSTDDLNSCKYPFQFDRSTKDGGEFGSQEEDVVVAVFIVVSVLIVVGGCTTLSSIVGVGGEPFVSIVRLIIVWFVSTQSYHLDSRHSRITFFSRWCRLQLHILSGHTESLMVYWVISGDNDDCSTLLALEPMSSNNDRCRLLVCWPRCIISFGCLLCK